MNENVRAAIVRLYETKALLTIKPFHCSGSHLVSPNLFWEKAHINGAGSIEVWKRPLLGLFPKQVQVAMPKIDERKIVTYETDCNQTARWKLPCQLERRHSDGAATQV